MKGLRIALAVLFVAACGGDSAMTGLDEPTPPPASGGILALGLDSTTGASIETNKDDYAPGEVVHLVGRGWAAGETVNLHMTEVPNTHADVDTNVVADAAGGFDIHFYDVTPHDFGVTFTLTATGRTSGSRAVATFTDGRSVNAVTLSPASPVPATTSVNATVKVLINNGTGAQVWEATKWEILNSSSVVIASSACIDTDDHALGDSDEFDGNKHEETIAFTSPATNGSYTLRISLYSTDNCGANPNDPTTGTILFSVSSSSPPVNTAPVLTGVPTTAQAIPELASYTFDANATDSDLPAQTLTFSIVGSLPTGASFNVATGEFEWTPTEAQGPSGPYTFTVRVSDGVTSTDQLVTLNVLEVNVAPQLTGVPTTTQNIPEMVLYSFDANASDSDEPAQTLTFSIVGSLPSGASFNTSTGVFEWNPAENQGPSGPHTFTVRVSDGVANTDQSVTINVLEVNRAPVLTVPADFSTQWGVSLPNDAATANDPDLPANTLTFSKVSGPTWVTVAGDGTISYGSIPSSAIGPHTVTIKVEDNGDPVMSDQESYVITVTARPTRIEYTGRNAGQYSDESTLSAELKDDGDGALNGTAISGAAVDLWFNGAVVCDDRVTNASGIATCDYQIPIGAATVKVKATFAAASGYAGSTSAEEDFVVSKENAEFVSVSINGGNGSIPVSQTSFSVTLGVKERLVSGNEPDQNDGQLPGNINLATVSAKITGLATNTSYNGVCTAGSAVATNAYATRDWSCSFSGGPFEVDAYTLALDIPTANSYWVAATYEEGLAVWDPNAGFATGGGTFMLDGDRVSFGFSYTLTKGKSTPRSGFVVIRHMAGGGVCRVKSNNQMNAPAVNGNTVTLSGKGNYSCVDANGQAIAGQSAGNISIAAYAEDNATSGADADKFWVTNGAPVTPNYLKMDGTGGAAVNAITLRGGNVQVPQPGRT